MEYPTVEKNFTCTTVAKKKSFDQEAIGNSQLVKEAKEAAKTYKEKKFYEGKPSATEQPLEMLIKETSKQKACESNTSFKEGRLVEFRIESETRKRGHGENEEGEGSRYVTYPFTPEISSVILLLSATRFL